MAVWLGVMQWVADSRYRKLNSSAHEEALEGFLESLDLHVAALKLAGFDMPVTGRLLAHSSYVFYNLLTTRCRSFPLHKFAWMKPGSS